MDGQATMPDEKKTTLKIYIISAKSISHHLDMSLVLRFGQCMCVEHRAEDALAHALYVPNYVGIIPLGNIACGSWPAPNIHY